MSFYADLLELLELVEPETGRPAVDRIDFPATGRAAGRDADFGSVVLSDGSVGLFYAWLEGVGDTPSPVAGAVGRPALEVVQAMIDGSPGERALALGVANAMGQAVFRGSGWQAPAGLDTLSELRLEEGDKVGMIGYFPTLVPRVQALKVPLVVVEKRVELVQEAGNFAVTTDLAGLNGCNKVICTGSVLLNDTVDEVLRSCSDAVRVIMVGPSVACLPDPLFNRGCNVVGSTEVVEPTLLRQHLRCGQKWGTAVRKYRIDSVEYPGTRVLLRRIGRDPARLPG